MNILTDKLPEAVMVSGRIYKVVTDFRFFIKFESDITKAKDGELSAVISTHLRDFYMNNVPLDVNAAINKMLWFYRCGAEPEKQDVPTTAEPQTKARRYYDYEQDGQYIYAAFKSQYGADLNADELHWWTFKAMFAGLSDCMFVQIMQYRGTDLSKIKNREEKERIRKLQEVFRLRDDRIKRYANAAEHDNAIKAQVKARYEQARKMLEESKKGKE